jgi:hypothetical protein
MPEATMITATEAVAIDRLPAIVAADLELPSYSAQVAAIVVATEDDRALANNTEAYIDAKIKSLKAQRERYVKPLREHIALIDSDAKPVIEAWLALRAVVKGKVRDYLAEQERLKLVEDERLRLEGVEDHRRAEQRRAMIAADAAAKGIDPELVTPAPQPLVIPQTAPLERVTKTDLGSTSQKLVWKVEIVDEQAVPWEYCTKKASLQRLNIAVADGKRDIPGCRIYRDLKNLHR